MIFWDLSRSRKNKTPPLTTVKLLDYEGRSESLPDNNPFGVIVAAHLTTQQTNQNPDRRYQGKLSIAKSLYQRGYSRQDILELFRLS